MLGQHDARLHHVEIVQHLGIGFGQAGREEVRLLLIVTFEADTIPGPDHRFEQGGHVIGCYDLTLGEFAARLEAIVADSPFALPVNHIVQLQLIGLDAMEHPRHQLEPKDPSFQSGSKCSCGLEQLSLREKEQRKCRRR